MLEFFKELVWIYLTPKSVKLHWETYELYIAAKHTCTYTATGRKLTFESLLRTIKNGGSISVEGCPHPVRTASEYRQSLKWKDRQKAKEEPANKDPFTEAFL